MRLTKDNIKFIKRVSAGAGRQAYLEHPSNDNIVGYWLPAAEDLEGGKAIGPYVGVGNDLAITSSRNNPSVNAAIESAPDASPLAVLFQDHIATHLVAIASPKDYVQRGRFTDERYPNYRWAKVLGLRNDTILRDVLTAQGVNLEADALPFENQGGSYINLDHIAQFRTSSNTPARVREAIWRYFMGDAPAFYTGVVDPGDQLGMG